MCWSHDSQPGVAVRAQALARCFAKDRGERCDGRGSIGRHEFPAFGDVPFAVVIAVTAEAMRLRVAFRQNMQNPATHEFDAAQRDIFRRVSLADASRESDDPVFGDGKQCPEPNFEKLL